MTSITALRMSEILRGLQSRLQEGLPWTEFESWEKGRGEAIPEEWRPLAMAAYDSGYQAALTDALRRVKEEIGA